MFNIQRPLEHKGQRIPRETIKNGQSRENHKRQRIPKETIKNGQYRENHKRQRIPKETIKNGQYRETGNIGCTRQRNTKQKYNTTEYVLDTTIEFE